MRTGVQSLGWYVLRAADPVPLIRFYRDRLGLGELRGREYPAEHASAMLWAGGMTVFEPNRLAPGGNQGETLASIDDCPFVPVFRSTDLAATEARLRLDPDTTVGKTSYYRDPLGFYFGIEPVDAKTVGDRLDPVTGESPMIPDIKPLADDLADLGRLEYRVPDPDRTAAFYGATLGLTQIGNSDNAIRLNMGDGATLDIKLGHAAVTGGFDDREQVTMVPVFRLYGYDDYCELMAEAGASCLQQVELTGGRLWYGWDQAGHLFGFQERKPPDPDPEKWTTRLPEDLIARRLWEGG